jgi:hypothetical protein
MEFDLAYVSKSLVIAEDGTARLVLTTPVQGDVPAQTFTVDLLAVAPTLE